ncbi:MAG: hypothetical protein Q9161_000818 [Pseudevernia consocians]
MLNPGQWYEGRVDVVHDHWRWLTVKEKEHGEMFTLEPAYDAVHMELTVEANKNVRFTLNPETGKVKEIEVLRG